MFGRNGLIRPTVEGYLGHILSLIGVAMIGYGVTQPWLVVVNAYETQFTATTGLDVVIHISGVWISVGWLTLGVGLTAAVLTIVAIALQRRSLVAGESVTFVFLLGLHLLAVFGAPVPARHSLGFGGGFWWSVGGSTVVLLGALRVFATAPAMSKARRPLRVAVLWNGTVQRELLLAEPRRVTLGGAPGATFVIPDVPGLGDHHVLFSGGRGDRYTLNLVPGMTGRLSLGQEETTVTAALEREATLTVSDEDWGVINLGPLAVFFQFVVPEERIAPAVLSWLDSNELASVMTSTVAHVGAIVLALFFWDEEADPERRQHAFHALQIIDGVEQLPPLLPEQHEEPEEILEPAPNDELAKYETSEYSPVVDESPFDTSSGGVAIRPSPTRGKRSAPGASIVDVINSAPAAGGGALANIMRGDTSGIHNKLVTAMDGAEEGGYVAGSGIAGMGFRYGSGGGPDAGRGLRSVGRIDRGQMRSLKPLDRKRKAAVTRLDSRTLRAAGGCKAGDIARVVRRRAGAIRACYENALQTSPGLGGKLRVRWTIGLDGRVRNAVAAGGTLTHGGVRGCVLRAIRRMRFSRPDRMACVVQWPFVFSPGR